MEKIYFHIIPIPILQVQTVSASIAATARWLSTGHTHTLEQRECTHTVCSGCWNMVQQAKRASGGTAPVPQCSRAVCVHSDEYRPRERHTLVGPKSQARASLERLPVRQASEGCEYERASASVRMPSESDGLISNESVQPNG